MDRPPFRSRSLPAVLLLGIFLFAEVAGARGKAAARDERASVPRKASLKVETRCEGGPCTAEVDVGGTLFETDAGGKAPPHEFEPGTYTVEATHDRYRATEYEARTMVELAPGEKRTVTLDLVRSGHGDAVLEGRVVAPDGTPRVGILVAATCGGLVRAATTNVDGRYRIEGLNPGRCERVSASEKRVCATSGGDGLGIRATQKTAVSVPGRADFEIPRCSDVHRPHR